MLIKLNVNSIDDIKGTVSSIDSKMTEMRSEIDSSSKRVTEVETSQSFISKAHDDSIRGIEKLNKKVEMDIDSMKTKTKTLCESKVNFQKIVKANEKLNTEFESIQSVTMRDNLLFHGIKGNESKDCVVLIKQIIENNLNIEEEIEIKSAFRLGKKKEFGAQQKQVVENPERINIEPIRPILVKFVDRLKIDGVRKSSFKLKGSNISITDHYPKSVVDKRRILIPLLKKAREADVKAVLIREKLFVGGVLYTGDSIDVAIENAKRRKSDAKNKPVNSDVTSAAGNDSESVMQTA